MHLLSHFLCSCLHFHFLLTFVSLQHHVNALSVHTRRELLPRCTEHVSLCVGAVIKEWRSLDAQAVLNLFGYIEFCNIKAGIDV